MKHAAHKTHNPNMDFQQPGKRIVVFGSSGSGKTTTAEIIGQRLGIPHVEMDALYWRPDWQETELQEFREKISQALTGPTWVADGNYSKVRDITWSRADTLVWLDLPLSLVLLRLTNRTLRRWITRETLWNGNRETLKGAIFSKDSLFLWMLKSRIKHHREYPRLMKEPQFAHLKVIHLTSAAMVDAWLDNLDGS